MKALFHRLGETGPYFANRVCSGSHLHSLAMVRCGDIDAAVIDSTVMEMAGAVEPAIFDEVRTLTRIGPYSMPLIALSPACPLDLRQAIETTLVNMHETATGATLLTRWQIARFTPVQDRLYDDIRQMMVETEGINL